MKGKYSITASIPKGNLSAGLEQTYRALGLELPKTALAKKELIETLLTGVLEDTGEYHLNLGMEYILQRQIAMGLLERDLGDFVKIDKTKKKYFYPTSKEYIKENRRRLLNGYYDLVKGENYLRSKFQTFVEKRTFNANSDVESHIIHKACYPIELMKKLEVEDIVSDIAFDFMQVDQMRNTMNLVDHGDNIFFVNWIDGSIRLLYVMKSNHKWKYFLRGLKVTTKTDCSQALIEKGSKVFLNIPTNPLEL